MTKRMFQVAPVLAACTLMSLAAQASHAAAGDSDSHDRADRQIVVYENGHVLSQEGG